MWLEAYIVITSGIGAFFTIMSSLGPDVFPVLVGQFIESRPMAVMYLTLGIVLFCVGLFALAAVAGRVYKRTAPKDEKAVAREEEENQPLKA